MKAERWAPFRHTTTHTSAKDALLGTLVKHEQHIREDIPAFITHTRYFSYQTTKRAGFKLPREAARSNHFSLILFEIWEREPLPLN